MKSVLLPALALVLAVSGVPAAVARSGKEIYQSNCIMCHATGAAGAPKLDDRAAWGPRLETGRDALMHSLVNGKNAHPPRGTCTDCSTTELREALDYMIARIR